MAVYFAPQRRHWTEYALPVAGNLLNGLIGNMFSRSERNHEAQNAETKGRLLQDMFNYGSDNVTAPTSAPVMQPGNQNIAMPPIDYAGMNEMIKNNPDAGKVDFAGINEMVRNQHPQEAFNIGAAFNRVGNNPQSLQALGRLEPDYFMKLAEFAEKTRLQALREGIASPVFGDRESTSNYFAELAKFAADPNTMKVISDQMKHMTPHLKFGALDLGDRKKVYSSDPWTGNTNVEMSENVGVSPNVSAQIAAGRYDSGGGRRASDWVIKETAEGLVRINKYTGEVQPLGVDGKPRSNSGGWVISYDENGIPIRLNKNTGETAEFDQQIVTRRPISQADELRALQSDSELARRSEGQFTSWNNMTNRGQDIITRNRDRSKEIINPKREINIPEDKLVLLRSHGYTDDEIIEWLKNNQ